MTYDETPQSQGLRDRALRRLKKRRDFRAHVLIYTLVNGFLVVIWAMTGAGVFWPIFPILGWGIGLLANAYDVYIGDDITEEQIQREMQHLDSRG